MKISQDAYNDAFARRDFANLLQGGLAGVQVHRRSGTGPVDVFPGGYGLVFVGTSRRCADDASLAAYKVFYDIDLTEVATRYELISAFIAKNRSLSLLKRTQAFVHTDALRVGQHTVPVVEMPYFEHPSIWDWLSHSPQSDPPADALGAELLLGLRELESAGASHNDLSAANVLVPTIGELTLIDYDNMCVPGLEGSSSLTVGSVMYQYGIRELAERKLAAHGDFWSGISLALELLFWTRERDQLYREEDRVLDLAGHALHDSICSAEVFPAVSFLFNEWKSRWSRFQTSEDARVLEGSLVRLFTENRWLEPALRSLVVRRRAGSARVGSERVDSIEATPASGGRALFAVRRQPMPVDRESFGGRTGLKEHQDSGECRISKTVFAESKRPVSSTTPVEQAVSEEPPGATPSAVVPKRLSAARGAVAAICIFVALTTAGGLAWWLYR